MLWAPDTCNVNKDLACQITWENKSIIPGKFIELDDATDFEFVRCCDAHKGMDKSVLRDVLLKENRDKNSAFDLIAKHAPELYSNETKNADTSKILFTFDKDRNLNIATFGMTTNKAAVQSVLDSGFDRKVTIN